MYRCDRLNRRGGGVLVAIKKIFTSHCIYSDSNLEIIWAVSQTRSVRVLIGACYRPPDSNEHFIIDLRDSISNALKACQADMVYLLGDFNFPHIDWAKLTSSCQMASDFINLILDFNFTQVVNQPTRGSNILDLVFTSNPERVEQITYIDGFSDHYLLQLSINIPLPFTGMVNKTIRNYSKGDYTTMNAELELFFHNEFLPSLHSRTVEENWVVFRDKLCSLVNQCIPLIKITNDKSNPWFTNSLKRFRNKKKRVYRSAKKLGTPAAWAKYSECLKNYNLALSTAKDKYFFHDLPSLLNSNPKKFWQVISPNCDTDSISLHDSDHVPIPDNECPSSFNRYFSSIFSEEDYSTIPEVPDFQYQYMTPIEISIDGIITLVNNLKLSNSCGVDGINSKVLKNTVTTSSKILYHIFRLSLSSGELPSDWKTAKVVPIFKSGDKHTPGNYRPISLTCICCKMLEHIIASHIYNHLEANKFFFTNQHGFRRGFSCETQLLEFTTDLHFDMDNNLQIDSIFLDFSKAFDRVAHCRLISKLTALKLDSQSLTWLRNFLSNRQQFTIVNNLPSPLCHVTSGVPQGSVLGPLLFIIYINDLPNNLASRVRLFADDCIIYRPISSPDDHHIIQNDLQLISDWCKTWLMTLNSSKCKIISFTRKHSVSNFPYHINHNPISAATTYKYLGIHLTSNLSWNLHVTTICATASKSLGYLRRTLRNSPSNIRKLAFQTFVRPQLEYASPIWSPHHNNLISLLESVQNRAARFISHNYTYKSSISRIKQDISLPPLSARRDLALISLFHKYVYAGKQSSLRLEVSPCTSRRLHNHLSFTRMYGSTHAFNSSALPRAIRLWNALPDSIVSEKNPDKFRQLIISHYSA